MEIRKNSDSDNFDDILQVISVNSPVNQLSPVTQ